LLKKESKKLLFQCKSFSSGFRKKCSLKGKWKRKLPCLKFRCYFLWL